MRVVQRTTKTFLLWIALIVIFVALYNVLSSDVPREPRAECETSWSQVAITWSISVVLFVALITWIRWQQRRFRAGHEGVKLMHEGRHLQALAVFQRDRENAPQDPAPTLNCGLVQLVLWRLDAARKDLDRAKSLKGAGEGMVAVLWAEHYPLLCALQGRADEGFRILEQAPKEAAASRIKLSQGALLVRRGEWEAARGCLNSLEAKQLGGLMGALARTLDAMCIEQLTGELRHVDRIGLFGEASPDELRKNWPEFVQFVERAPAW